MVNRKLHILGTVFVGLRALPFTCDVHTGVGVFNVYPRFQSAGILWNLGQHTENEYEIEVSAFLPGGTLYKQFGGTHHTHL